MGSLNDKLVARALEEGFDLARVCRPWDVGHVPDRLAAFLGKAYHGQMGWLAERSHWRGDPHALWPEARSLAKAIRPRTTRRRHWRKGMSEQSLFMREIGIIMMF